MAFALHMYIEKGYMVKQVISTDTGLEIPLAVIPSRPIHGKTIHHLVVEVDFETSERLHVKVKSILDTLKKHPTRVVVAYNRSVMKTISKYPYLIHHKD